MNETRKQTLPGVEKAGWAKALVMALCPLLFAILACALQGKTIADVYIPASEWNDELFYYKLTENVVKFGFPQGYFGFNESHGIYLSFAAWSPVLLLPWVIWGKLLGWNLLSPVLCNLFLMMGTMFLLGRLLRPTWKQVAAIVIPFGVYSQMTRFTLSGMPEVAHWCLMLLIVGLFVSFIREEKTWKLAVSIVLIVLLTWMRPYFILLFFFPFLYLIRKDKRHILTLFAVLGLTGGVYYWINHYLSAPYLTDLFYTDWIKAFGERGLGGGLLFMLHRLWDSFLFIARMAIQCVLTGYASGGLYLGFLIIGLLLLIAFVRECKRTIQYHKRQTYAEDASAKKELSASSAWMVLLLQLLLCFAGFFAAILLMYRLQEGGRHVIAFVAAGILVLAMREYDRVSYFVRAGLIILSFAFLYIVRANTPYDFQIPFRTDALQAEIEDLQAQLETEMELSADPVPNFDNTIVWVIWDYVGEEAVAVKWQQFYAVPKGFGINLCYAEYVTGQGDALNSRYVGTIPGGNVDHYLAERGKKVIAQNKDLIVYDRFEEAD
ncbi:MAG: hypothetical protein K6A92_04975 [Lachnospiraceae bacterium]|nr:hypothetical protein [Lachnospiraceae bacterium]